MANGTSHAAPYYHALDGLRAMAVLMVFCQHYGAGKAWVFGWGWMGVDVFFVLSGFLITGILYDSRHRPHRYRDFYIRRTLRIFPLYYFIWIVIFLAAPVAQWHWNWRWTLWPVYLGNYARFLFLGVPGTPYQFDQILFGPPAQRWFGSPMHLWIGHFWSLCVEEQFYLVWPFVVYTVGKRQWLIRICLGAIVGAPMLRWVLTLVASSEMLRMELLYRSLPTRLDALLMGGLLALLLRSSERVWVVRWRRWVMAISSILLLTAYMFFVKVKSMPFYGSATNWMGVVGFSLIDLFAAALIVECIDSSSFVGRIFSLSWLRGLGIISYGFYVYHDLLHDVYGYVAGRCLPFLGYPGVVLVALLGTLLLATMSYRFMEGPLLRLKNRFTDQVHHAPTA